MGCCFSDPVAEEPPAMQSVSVYGSAPMPAALPPAYAVPLPTPMPAPYGYALPPAPHGYGQQIYMAALQQPYYQQYPAQIPYAAAMPPQQQQHFTATI